MALTKTAKRPKAAWAGFMEQQQIYNVTVFHMLKLKQLGRSENKARIVFTIEKRLHLQFIVMHF